VQIWQKILISTTVTLLLGGSYLHYVWNQRRSPGIVVQSANQRQSADQDVLLRALYIQHFDDTRQLANTTLWMKNGATISYFPYKNGHIDFAHSEGTIPPLQRLEVKKIVQSVVPATVFDGIGHGDRQAFIVFNLPGAAALYASPIGAQQAGDEAYYCDLLYFYDDPRSVYDHWSHEVWAAIDSHQVNPGMSELQTRLSIGQKMHAGSGKEGDRTNTYDGNGKEWTVTFVHDRATNILTRVKTP
jgi:hypothetical protein